jgi:hypothetical protein
MEKVMKLGVTLALLLFAAPACASAEPVYDPQPPSAAAPSDTMAPQTTIDRSTLRAATRTARFWFSSSEPPQGFYCQLDKGDLKPCGPPRTYRRLKPGRHAFRVQAVDAAGNVDSSPAVVHFRIPPPSRGRR